MRVFTLEQCRGLALRVEDGDVGLAVAALRQREPPFGNGVGGPVEQVEEVVVSARTARPGDELGGDRALFVEVRGGMVVAESERAVGAGRQFPTEQLQEGVFPLLVLP